MKACMGFLVACICAGAPSGALCFSETIELQSRTVSDEEFLGADAADADPVSLKGVLKGPDGNEKVAAVILLHGTDGPGSGSVWNWSRYLNSIGVATFELDSYSGRGLQQASADQSTFPQFTQIYDAYRAVETLAVHPRIDASRVGLMGFSRGGNAALFSAMTRFQRAFGPKTGSIAAHFPFYPACNFELREQGDVGPAPIRLFHGADDDWTPAAPCKAYVDRLADAGYDARMTVFPGALHAFDSPSSPSHHADSAWQTSRNCTRREEGGQLVNAATGRPFTYDDACVEYGPGVQYNDDAAMAAQSAVRDIIAALPSAR